MALLLFFLFNILCLWLLIKNFDFSRLYPLLVASFYLYYFLSLFDYFAGDNILGFKEQHVISELLYLNTFIAGFIIASLFKRKKPTPDIPAAPSYEAIVFSSYTLIVAGIVMYIVFIYLAYGGFHAMSADRYELYQKKKGWGSLLIGLNICFTGLLIRLGYFMLYRKTTKQPFPFAALIITLVLLAFQLHNSDRSNLLFFLLPFTVVCLYIYPAANKRLIYIVPSLLILMQVISFQRMVKNADEHKKFEAFYHNERFFNVLGMVAVSEKVSAGFHHHAHKSQTDAADKSIAQAREIGRLRTGMEQVNRMLDKLSLAKNAFDISKHGEFTAPGKVDMVINEHLPTIKTRYGGTFTDALLNLPPSWLVRHRPKLPAEWYVSTFYPEEYKRGGGMGFSVIAEGLINFYIAGPFLLGFLLGTLLLYMEQRLNGGSFYYFIIYCTLAFYVFIMPRSGITGLIKPALISVILPMVLVSRACSLILKQKQNRLNGN